MGRSTLHALVSILHLWTTSLDAGQSVRTVFVDFRKAFDLVDHNILLRKLQEKSVPKQLCKWFESFLFQRRQRVRVTGYPHSQWLFLNGGMPQGSLLGPVSFIIHIDDLQPLCDVLKYVDDTTLTEIIGPKSSASAMQCFLEQLLTWSNNNNMQINGSKTKEMILGSASRRDLPALTINDTHLERVSVFKLLGVYVSSDLRWETHIEYIVSKAVSRLYFLKHLKRAGLTQLHLLHFYLSVIRPVLEYASPLWHPTLTKSQSDRLEAVQRRALNIIFCCTSATPYIFTLALADISSLQGRRLDHSRRLFQNICQVDSCLHHLLPLPRDPAVTSRLRKPTKYPRPSIRTAKYCSTLSFALVNFQ